MEVKKTKHETVAKLRVRAAGIADIPALLALSMKVYPSDHFSAENLHGQITRFPKGQFLVEYEGQVVGYCATCIIGGELALRQHTWAEITGGGYAARHAPDGDYLYAMDICVDSAHRGLRIGSRLYNHMKKLCRDLKLKGVVFGSRMPGYGRRKDKVQGPGEYLRLVEKRKIKDPAVGFQLSHDFTLIGVLENYLPNDRESLGYAAHMVWKNPLATESVLREAKKRGPLPQLVRVATVQFQMRKVESEAQFEKHLEYFIDVASDYGADFIVFPELITLALLSMESGPMQPEEAVEHLTGYTERYKSFMQRMAISYNVNIIGGSHPTKAADGDIHNICCVFLRDGAVHAQEKLHPSPSERYWWGIKGGDTLRAIQTDCGPIGVLPGYDAEFPEAARHLTDQGALILFVPFCANERQEYLRVRYCAQARAVENQCYVVMAGTVGNIPDIENMDINYAESCILTPCDFPFARDGVAATTAPNTEMIAFADLQLETLLTGRQDGSAQNLRDRRFDLYSVQWKPHKGT